MPKQNNAKTGTKGKKDKFRFVIDCALPIEDNVLVLGDFESFLSQKIKVDGKTGNLGANVTVSKAKDTIVVESSVPFSKRYLKYLSKKYLKKQDMREYLRLVASNKNTYTMKYLNIANDEAAAPEGK